jgi:hypothetical protein
MYVVAVCLIPYFQVGRYLGWFRGELHFSQVVGDSSTIFMIARTISCLAGVASVSVLHGIARRLFGEETAVLAAGFLGLAFLHARDSHFGVTDVTATFLILASFRYLVRLESSGSRSDRLKAAVAAGLATSTKYNAAMIAIPGLWLVLCGTPGVPRSLRARFADGVRFVVIMVVAFLATSPYVVLAFDEFWPAIRGVFAHLAGGHGIMLGRGWVVHFLSSLRYGLGAPLLVTGVLGLVLFIMRDRRKGTLLALFPVVYYVVVGSGLTVFARHIIPTVPFLCLSAAFAVYELAGWIATRMRRPTLRAAIGYAIGVIIIAPSAWSIWQFDRLLGRTDSRVLAAEWISHRFPDGATVGQMGRLSSHLFFKPERPGEPSRFRTVDLTDTMPDPDVIVVPMSPLYPNAVSSRLLESFLGRYQLELKVETSTGQASDRIYDWQDEFYLPLSGFGGIVRPGPDLEIYVRKRTI